MAMTKCSECGASISTAAATCPNCGAPVKSAVRTARTVASRIWLGLKIFVALIAGLIAFTCTSSMRGVGERAAETRPAAAQGEVQATPPGTTPQAAAPFAAAWRYPTETDELTKKPTKFAVLQSIDQLQLQSPYNGRNFGTLTVRQSERFGTNAYFEIERGQLICGYGDGCQAAVSFDGATPRRFTMSKPADHSSTLLFFRDAQGFIQAARKAKSIRIAMVVYQAGEPTLEFRTDDPLVWPPAAR